MDMYHFLIFNFRFVTTKDAKFAKIFDDCFMITFLNAKNIVFRVFRSSKSHFPIFTGYQ